MSTPNDYNTPIPLDAYVPPGPLSGSVKRAVEQSLAEIVPPGRTGAMVGVATADGPSLQLATRIGHHWVLAAEAKTDWSASHVEGRVMLHGSW